MVEVCGTIAVVRVVIIVVMNVTGVMVVEMVEQLVRPFSFSCLSVFFPLEDVQG